MLDNDALTKYLAKARGLRYADIRTVNKSCITVALRKDSFEIGEYEDSIVGCRAVDNGYGVSSTNRIEGRRIETALERAIEHAHNSKGTVKLIQVNPENGRYEHPVKKKPTVNDAKEVIMQIADTLKNGLGSLASGIEIMLSYTEFETGLATSEGTNVKESFGTTDLTIILTIRSSSGITEVKKVAGGNGGMETIQHRDFENIVDDLIIISRSSTGARRFSPLDSGKKFSVILDGEAAGALAQLIAHMLVANDFSSKAFDILNMPKELEIVDNPSIPGAYGSFVWDDEGVRGRKKVLVSNGSLNLLHTRLTAGNGGIPGNARGVSHIPKPSTSNVYISTSDWHLDEMLSDTKQGIFMKGVRRAEVNIARGIIELEPTIAYLIEQKEIKEAMSNVKLIDTVKNILQKIDAIGKLISLTPKTEHGFHTSMGAPYIRIDGARCAYSVMQ